MVRSVTDTTTDSVPSEPGAGDAPAIAPPNRWWAWALAVIGVVVLGVIGVASLLPSTLVGEKENSRTGDLEPTPYALTPASADAARKPLSHYDDVGWHEWTSLSVDERYAIRKFL